MFSHQKKRIRPAMIAAGAIAGAALVLSACSGAGDNGSNGAGGGGEQHFFTLATGATAGTPNAAVQDWYLDEIEAATDGRITFDRTATEALCRAPEVVECLRDGRAQIGVTIPDYTPQFFPSVSVVGIPFIGQNSQAITASLYELHTDYEPGAQLIEDLGLHYVATWPVGRLIIGTEEPVEAVADLNGLQSRTSGPVIQRLLSDAGMNINAITASETYEAVERGVIGSVAGAIDFPVNYRLMELLPYWSDPGIGQYSTFGMWFSLDAYDSLSDELKEIVDEVTARLNGGDGVEAFNVVAAGQCAEMLSSNSVEDFAGWGASESDAWASEVGDTSEQVWLEVAEGYGLTDADAFLAEYTQGLERHSAAQYDDATLDCVEQFAAR